MTVELKITLDTATNAISVTGPIHDRLLCYGLLEEGRVIVTDAAKKAAAHPAIVRATELPRQ